MTFLQKVVIYTLVTAVTLTPVCWVGWKIFINFKIKEGKRYYNTIKKLPKYYVYDTTGNSLNPVFYIDTLIYKNELISYYDSSNLDYRKVIRFPTQMVVLFKPVFINTKNHSNSNLVSFVDFDTTCFGFIKGYVCKKFLFNQPPPDSLITEYEKTFEELQKHLDYSTGNAISRSRGKSIYGIQCDCN